MPRRNRRQTYRWTPRIPAGEFRPLTTEDMARELVRRGLASRGILEHPMTPAPSRRD